MCIANITTVHYAERTRYTVAGRLPNPQLDDFTSLTRTVQRQVHSCAL